MFLFSAEKEKNNKEMCSFLSEVKSVLKEIKLDDITLESSPTVHNEQEKTEGKLLLLRNQLDEDKIFTT